MSWFREDMLGKEPTWKALREQRLGEEEKKTRKVKPKENKPKMKMDSLFQDKEGDESSKHQEKSWDFMGPNHRGRWWERAPSPARGIGRPSSPGWRCKQVDQQEPAPPQDLRLEKTAAMRTQPYPLLHTGFLLVPWTGYGLPTRVICTRAPLISSGQFPLTGDAPASPLLGTLHPLPGRFGFSLLCFRWLVLSGCPATKPYRIHDQKERKMEQKQKGSYALTLCHSE